ncbi:hypothetical protein C0995_005221 [Termitomyces sp. Mi166|nr:hypothetical protein C0995_005221 [Termitomyces sp. Mi166\
MIDGTTQPGAQLVGKAIDGSPYAIYQSPILPDKTHNLTIMANISSSEIFVLVDYATIMAGENTPFQTGQDLIVDETDPSIIFDGDWTLNTSFPVFKTVMVFHRNGGNHDHRLAKACILRPMETQLIKPHHQVQQPRSNSMVGTSVSVFGVQSLRNTNLEMTYIVDDGPTQSGPVIVPIGQSMNFQWFHKEGLAATNHTLVMTVRQSSENVFFNLDYIVYTPSFASLAEEKGLSIQQSSSSQSQATSTATGPQISTTPITAQPGARGTFHGKLLAAVIVPVLFGVIAIILFIMRRKKLLFWSSRQPSTIGFSQLRVYHKSGAVNGRNVESPIPDHDLPLFGMTTTSDGVLPATHRRVRWWARLWRHRQHGTLEAFPSNWNPSNSNRPMIQRKPPLPAWASRAGQRESRQSDTGTANETIIFDPRVQELEELVFSLQQEIEETRQDRSGAQNGALMRELVENHTELPNEHGRENGDHVSVTMSATVV